MAHFIRYFGGTIGFKMERSHYGGELVYISWGNFDGLCFRVCCLRGDGGVVSGAVWGPGYSGLVLVVRCVILFVGVGGASGVGLIGGGGERALQPPFFIGFVAVCF